MLNQITCSNKIWNKYIELAFRMPFKMINSSVIPFIPTVSKLWLSSIAMSADVSLFNLISTNLGSFFFIKKWNLSNSYDDKDFNFFIHIYLFLIMTLELLKNYETLFIYFCMQLCLEKKNKTGHVHMTWWRLLTEIPKIFISRWINKRRFWKNITFLNPIKYLINTFHLLFL